MQKKPLVFVNVGARDEENDLFFQKSAPFKIEIVGFEPDPEEFARLSNLTPKIDQEGPIKKFYPYALGEKTEKRPLYLFKDRRLSSMLKPNTNLLNKFPIEKLLSRDAFRIDETIELETRPLDEIYKSENGNMPHFIKIDTQGTELEILKGAQKILDTCFALLIEVEFVELYENQPTFTDIDLYLRSQGFSLMNIERVLWKRDVETKVASNGQLIFGDALYFRDITATNHELQKPFFEKFKSDEELALKTLWLSAQLGYSDMAEQMLKTYLEKNLISKQEAEYFKKHIVKKYVPESSPNILQRGLMKVNNRLQLLKKKKSACEMWVNEHFYYKDKF